MLMIAGVHWRPLKDVKSTKFVCVIDIKKEICRSDLKPGRLVRPSLAGELTSTLTCVVYSRLGRKLGATDTGT
jgi:hypothetical protein